MKRSQHRHRDRRRLCKASHLSSYGCFLEFGRLRAKRKALLKQIGG